MSLDQARQFADHAAQCLQGGQPLLALDLAEQALMLEPGMGDAENLRGIALSQAGQPRAAEDAFLQAAKAMPRSAKPLYNLAVHYYGLGRKQDALDWTAQALQREPDHPQAFSLHTLIQNASPNLAASPASDLSLLEIAGDAYGDGIRFDWVRDHEATWLSLGWSLAVADLIAMVAVVTAKPGAYDNSVPGYLFGLFLGAYLFGFAFVLIDSLARGRSKAWAALYGVSGCFLGWGLLPLYLLTKSRRARTNS